MCCFVSLYIEPASSIGFSIDLRIVKLKTYKYYLSNSARERVCVTIKFPTWLKCKLNHVYISSLATFPYKLVFKGEFYPWVCIREKLAMGRRLIVVTIPNKFKKNCELRRRQL